MCFILVGLLAPWWVDCCVNREMQNHSLYPSCIAKNSSLISNFILLLFLIEMNQSYLMFFKTIDEQFFLRMVYTILRNVTTRCARLQEAHNCLMTFLCLLSELYGIGWGFQCLEVHDPEFFFFFLSLWPQVGILPWWDISPWLSISSQLSVLPQLGILPQLNISPWLNILPWLGILP